MLGLFLCLIIFPELDLKIKSSVMSAKKHISYKSRKCLTNKGGMGIMRTSLMRGGAVW